MQAQSSSSPTELAHVDIAPDQARPLFALLFLAAAGVAGAQTTDG